MNSNHEIGSKIGQLGFYIVVNIFGIVMVGKGVLHLSNDAAAGYFELLLGTVILISTPWAQKKTSETNSNKVMPVWWVLVMGFFAVYAFIGMINPFI